MKLTETLREQMVCKCGYPIASPPVTMYEGFGYKRVIVEYKEKCMKCGRENVFNG
ncbi:hypothetical protein [Bacillus wiedmannii]|uniref:hypothetical protein n=1 Tax=Bacillus wiedmannii TaxID=1890302 RepID=UPI003D1D24EE